MDFGWYGEADASGAVTFLARQPDVDPERIGLLGLSMGGEQAIGAAGADPRVAAVVAEGATARVADDKGYLSAYGIRGEVQQWVDRLTYAATDLLTDAPRPASLRDSVAVATGRADPTPFLLIAAGHVETETLAAEHIRAGHDVVRTWTVPGAGHTQGLQTAPAEWEQRVVGFLDGTLR
jgi:dienelactone hydrolase